MHYLAVTGVKAALDFLWRVRQTTDPTAFVAVVLQGLKTLIPCDLTSYNEFQAASRAFERTWSFMAEPPKSADGARIHYPDASSRVGIASDAFVITTQLHPRSC
ncbi:MAG TPA: hypothetical protein VEP50_00320, partial [bacterium]|nr:hypothetical protein [bacterium]